MNHDSHTTSRDTIQKTRNYTEFIRNMAATAEPCAWYKRSAGAWTHTGLAGDKVDATPTSRRWTAAPGTRSGAAYWGSLDTPLRQRKPTLSR